MQIQVPSPLAAADTPLAAIRTRDGTFKNLTESGNAAFADGNDRLAERHYRAARDEAERLLVQAAANDGTAILLAPMALTVACHNLATLKVRAMEMVEARALAIHPVERLIAIAASPAQPLALRLNCVRHLRHGLAALAGFVGRARMADADVDALGRRASDVAETVVRTAVLMRAAGGMDRTDGMSRTIA